MSAVVKIDGESRGAQEAIAKVEVGLRGVASTAVASSSTTSSALGGMAASFGRMTTAVFLGGSAVEIARKGLQFLTSSVSEYIASNEEAQQQTAELRNQFTSLKMSLGAMVLELGDTTGATDLLTSALRLLGDTADAISGSSASGLREGVAGDLDILRGNAEQAAARIADLQREMNAIGTEYGSLTPLQQAASDITGDHVERYEELERQLATARGELDQYTAAVDRSSQAQAAAAAAAVQYAVRLAQFGGPNSEEARPTRSGGRSEARNAFGLTEREQAEVNSATRDAQAAFADFLQTDAAERRSRLDLVAALAAEEIEIERGKQAAIVELRASVKAGGLQADAEQAAAALDVIRGRQEDIARTTSDMVAGIISSNEKVSKSTIKGLANQLAVRGIEALYEGGMMLFRGNPAGLGLAALGGSALGAAKGLGSSISEGGGRGAGAAAAPVTNNNVQVRVVAPAGMTTDTAAYVAAAAEEGARRGLAQDRR